MRTYVHTYSINITYVPPSSSNIDVKAGESVMMDKSPHEYDIELFREDILLSIELPWLRRLSLQLLLSVSLNSEG